VAASGISSSSGSSRDKNRLRFLKNAPVAEVVAALFHRDPLDQIDRTLKHLLQRFLQAEEIGRTLLGVGFEFDQQIGIAAVGSKSCSRVAEPNTSSRRTWKRRQSSARASRLLLTAACMIGSGFRDDEAMPDARIIWFGFRT
jgi:hypothetical protein